SILDVETARNATRFENASVHHETLRFPTLGIILIHPLERPERLTAPILPYHTHLLRFYPDNPENRPRMLHRHLPDRTAQRATSQQEKQKPSLHFTLLYFMPSHPAISNPPA